MMNWIEHKASPCCSEDLCDALQLARPEVCMPPLPAGRLLRLLLVLLKSQLLLLSVLCPILPAHQMVMEHLDICVLLHRQLMSSWRNNSNTSLSCVLYS